MSDLSPPNGGAEPHVQRDAVEVHAVTAGGGLVAESRVPEQRSVGMPYEKTGIGQGSRFAVVVASVRKHRHVFEHDTPAIDSVEPEAGSIVCGVRAWKQENE